MIHSSGVDSTDVDASAELHGALEDESDEAPTPKPADFDTRGQEEGDATIGFRPTQSKHGIRPIVRISTHVVKPEKLSDRKTPSELVNSSNAIYSPAHESQSRDYPNAIDIYLDDDNGDSDDESVVEVEAPAAEEHNTDDDTCAIADGTDFDRAIKKAKSQSAFDGDLDQHLRRAARLGDVDLIIKLVGLGANMQSYSKAGMTSLHLAAYMGHGKAAAALLDLGAKDCLVGNKVVFRLDGQNKTVSLPDSLMLAALKGHDDTAEVLTKGGVVSLDRSLFIDSSTTFLEWTIANCPVVCGAIGSRPPEVPPASLYDAAMQASESGMFPSSLAHLDIDPTDVVEALCLAVKNQEIKVIDLLIRLWGYPEIDDDSELSPESDPMYQAVIREDAETTELLLRHVAQYTLERTLGLFVDDRNEAAIRTISRIGASKAFPRRELVIEEAIIAAACVPSQQYLEELLDNGEMFVEIKWHSWERILDILAEMDHSDAIFAVLVRLPLLSARSLWESVHHWIESWNHRILICAIETCHYELAKLLLDIDPTLASVRYAKGQTVLHHLCNKLINKPEDDFEVAFKVARLLLRSDPTIAHAQDDFNNTPFHFAIYDKWVELAKLLLETDPTVASFRDDGGETHLHDLIQDELTDKRRQIAKLLLETNVTLAHARRSSGETPFELAILRNEEEWAELLLESDTTLASPADRLGQTALHLAAHHNRTWAVELLLAAEPALATCPDGKGDTPAHTAAMLGNVEALDSLLEVDRTPIHQRNHAGKLPVHLALDSRSWPVLLTLLDFEPSHAAEVGRHRDEHGNSPVHRAAKHGDLRILDLLLKIDSAPILR
jgi:ankyrin repeat protein